MYGICLSKIYCYYLQCHYKAVEMLLKTVKLRSVHYLHLHLNYI